MAYRLLILLVLGIGCCPQLIQTPDLTRWEVSESAIKSLRGQLDNCNIDMAVLRQNIKDLENKE